MVDDIQCGKLVSEVVPYAVFVLNASIESGDMVFNRPGGDILFAVVCDFGVSLL